MIGAGSVVRIQASAGECLGWVQQITHVAHGDFPAIPGAPDSALVLSILKEFGIRRLAFISHRHGDQTVIFVALEDGRGAWRDLRRQSLEITEFPGPSYVIGHDGRTIQCLVCNLTSHNAHDVEFRYCGFCHQFHRRTAGLRESAERAR